MLLTEQRPRSLDGMSATRRFDITRVRLQHFRSIKKADVRLDDLTLLVGPNGSGKSNFVDSLRFVSQALSENLDNALRERGGVAEVRRRSTGHPTHFTIELDYAVENIEGTYMFKVGAVKGGDYRVTHEKCVVRYRDGLAHDDVFYEVRDGAVVDASFETTLPPAADDRLYLVHASAIPDFRPVFAGLSDVNVYNLNPGIIREPQRPDAGDLLRRDGSNLASVLEHLKRNAPDIKAKVEEYLRLVVPDTVSADRASYGAYESVEFRQRVEGREDAWTFPATSISDGTLRTLGILVALFAPGDTGYSPIGIEEPETALHPAAAGVLLEALLSASRERQVIATSHSPELLDSVDLRPENLLAVRASNGVTTIAPVEEATADALRAGTYTAGELLKVDQLQPAVDYMQPELFG